MRTHLLFAAALSALLIGGATAADVDKTVAQKNGWAQYAQSLQAVVDRVNLRLQTHRLIRQIHLP